MQTLLGLRGLPVFEKRQAMRLIGGKMLRPDQLLDRSSYQLISKVAKHLMCRAIGDSNRATGIHAKNALCGGFQ